MKTKYVSFSILTILALSLGWFLFIKEYDYQINFSVKTSPGTVFTKVLELENWTNSKNKIKEIKVLNRTSFTNIKQQINLKEATYTFNWVIKPFNDSITNVSVNILDNEHSIKQRLQLILGSSNFIEKATLKIKDFKKSLEQHIDKFRVKIIGKDIRPSYQSVIYVTFNLDLPDKVNGMMRKIIFLTQYLSKHKIKKTGNPFINVTKWDVQSSKISCEFGFPVENRTDYPKDSLVKIRKNIESSVALKAEYYGNYRYSDRAWFALYNYANQHNIKVKSKPFEIFFHDPHSGGDELDWKADVFLPLEN